jgi:hypothetical protein
MKTPLFILLCIVSVPAVCQDDEVLSAPRALFKTTPQSFLVNTLKVGVRFSINPGQKAIVCI